MSLEGTYRRLLLAYPQSYRERRGEEILATLMDDAAPGQTRPDRRATLDLMLGGLRERLGLHNPDGFAAGAALAAPFCLILTAVGAVATMIEGPRSTSQVVVMYAWLVVTAVWAAAPRFNAIVVAAALGVTVAAVMDGQAYELWRVLCWGLAAFIGCLSVLARSVHRARTVRFGVPIAVAVLIGLTVWWQVSPPIADGPVYVDESGVWFAAISDLVAIGAVVVGVAVAGLRGRARAAWAALVVLGAWAVSGRAAVSYLAAVDVVDQNVLVLGIVAALVGALVIVVMTTARRRGGGRGLHRAGSIAIGAAGAYVALPALDYVRGAGSSYWSGEDALVWNDVSPLWLICLGLLLVPAIADFWASAVVQRLLVVVAIAGAVGAWLVYPARPGPLPYLIYLLLLGLCTRGGGHRDRGALLGLGLGLVTVLLVSVSGTLVVDLTYLQLVGGAFAVLVPASVVALAALGLVGRPWWGPTAFAVAALWLAGVGSGGDLILLPIAAVAAGFSMIGLAVARLWPARTPPFGPMGEST